jgi:hypothetical protein
MPCYPKVIKIENFAQLLSQAKDRALVEHPVFLEKNIWLKTTVDAGTEFTSIVDQLDLDE